MTYESPSYFNDFSDAEYRIERAHDLYDSGHWSEALRELEVALEINPANSNWLFNKGLILDTLERYHDAIDAYLDVHELDPNDPEPLNCLAIDYTRVGQYDLALETFEKLEKLEPNFEPCYCNRIITYAELGQHEKAEEMFYLARQITEDCPLCYFNIGNSLFARRLYVRAIWCWEQTRTLSPHHPQINYRIALAHWANNNHSLAKDHFLGELSRHPGDIEVLIDTGILLLEMNELESAQEKFRRIIEIDSDCAQAHHYIGELLFYRGKLTQAVESFNRALALNPGQLGSHYRLGECYLLLGQVANAREHLLAELNLSPDQHDVLLDLGCLLEQAGQTTEAMHCFERAIDTEPDDPRGYQNLSLSYYLNGLVDQGIDLSQRVLEIDPKNVTALHNLAYANLLKSHHSSAYEYAHRAGQLAPNDNSIRALKRTIKIMHLYHRTIKPFRRLLKSH